MDALDPPVRVFTTPPKGSRTTKVGYATSDAEEMGNNSQSYADMQHDK